MVRKFKDYVVNEGFDYNESTLINVIKQVRNIDNTYANTLDFIESQIKFTNIPIDKYEKLYKILNKHSKNIETFIKELRNFYIK